MTLFRRSCESVRAIDAGLLQPAKSVNHISTSNGIPNHSVRPETALSGSTNDRCQRNRTFSIAAPIGRNVPISTPLNGGRSRPIQVISRRACERAVAPESAIHLPSSRGAAPAERVHRCLGAQLDAVTIARRGALEASPGEEASMVRRRNRASPMAPAVLKALVPCEPGHARAALPGLCSGSSFRPHQLGLHATRSVRTARNPLFVSIYLATLWRFKHLPRRRVAPIL